MLDDYTRERLSGWIADFTQGDAFGARSQAVVEHADGVLLAWLVAACERADVDPDDLELPELRAALLEHVARLQLPEDVHAAMPRLARDLLSDLEAQGRLGNGRELGLGVATAGEAYGRATRGEVEQLSRPGSKLGRNDLCPCGSGKKFKKCCMGR
ncbi:MAG: hypothetical protein DHS20C15_26370 [Planctomycetota bacterium]|nr:MAG: hypothetical protein DHS20C15_26370 [Planctomycetota bacterium]